MHGNGTCDFVPANIPVDECFVLKTQSDAQCGVSGTLARESDQRKRKRQHNAKEENMKGGEINEREEEETS